MGTGMDRATIILIGAVVVLGFCGTSPGADGPRADHLGSGEPPIVPLESRVPIAIRQTDINALGFVITNFGFFGDNFDDREPSMEYPLGSQIDHLIRAGLWIGAITAEDVTVVSTGTVTGYFGRSFATASEFTQRTGIKEQSKLVFSRFYADTAVSEQDLIAEYTDYPNKGGTRDSIPLYVGITQRCYLWSYKFAEAFVIVSFTIRNEDPEGRALTNIYLGMYGELASGWKGAHDTWPPSGWFYNKALVYFPELRMCAEHHYSFQNGRAPSWGAFSLLGTTGEGVPAIDDLNVSFNWLNWHEVIDDPLDDQDRYELMANRQIDDGSAIIPGVDDPVEVLAAGPIPLLAPGDSMTFVCAFIGGMDSTSLVENAQWAQIAFDNNYVLPAPPSLGRFNVVPDRNRLTLFWQDYPETELDPFYKVPDFEGYRIYITRKEGATSDDFELVRELDIVDSLGYDTGLESVEDLREWDDGDTTFWTQYSVPIDNLKDGFKYWISLTAYDRGMPEEGVESMESGVLSAKVLAIPGSAPVADGQSVCVFPNPYRGEAIWDGERDREKYIWFANLPARATIRIYTLAGDLVKTIRFDGSPDTALDGVDGIRWERGRTAVPGGICAWDLISDEDQAVATGLYIYSVEDSETGNNQIGKFLIIR